MNPMNASEPREDAVAVLPAKWRQEAETGTFTGGSGEAFREALTDCADELEAALAQQGAEPVAWIHPQDLALLHKCRGDYHNGHVGVWMRSEPGFLPLRLATGAPR